MRASVAASAGVAIAMTLLMSACSAADEAADGSGSEAAAGQTTTATAPADGRDVAAAKREAIEGYAQGVHASYQTSLASAEEMDVAVDQFLDDPTEETLTAAKEAWLTARDDYGPTEAFRFYGGPIDNEEDGVEGLINAWPLDEAYIDYVEGQADAGIINNPDDYPDITADILAEANEQGGEANVSTGWHAIEFLLWGQDGNADGPGARPVSDYTEADNADRRATYLETTSDLLLTHLQSLVDAWDPAGTDNFASRETRAGASAEPRPKNYYAEFIALPDDEALTFITTGIGELSRGELAGERMSVAYFDRSEEDEHSCFSDNTTADIVANAEGIRRVVEGDYPDVDVTGFADLVAAVDADLATSMTEEINASLGTAEEIPAPFDQHLRDDVADDDPGRASVLTAIEALEDQTDTIVEAADALGLAPAVS
jgi:putative iron-regulated protein